MPVAKLVSKGHLALGVILGIVAMGMLFGVIVQMAATFLNYSH